MLPLLKDSFSDVIHLFQKFPCVLSEERILRNFVGMNNLLLNKGNRNVFSNLNCFKFEFFFFHFALLLKFPQFSRKTDSTPPISLLPIVPSAPGAQKASAFAGVFFILPASLFESLIPAGKARKAGNFKKTPRGVKNAQGSV